MEVGLQVFPADRMKPEKVDGFLQELADVDLVLRYAIEGRQLIEIPKFQEHQDSRYRVPSQLPSFQQSGGIRRIRQQVKDEVDVEVKALDLKIGQENYVSAPDNGAARASSFERFWNQYPKKRSKGDALKAWSTLKPSAGQIELILAALERLKLCHDWRKDGGKWVPYPATWLRAMGWEDDPGRARTGPDELEGL